MIKTEIQSPVSIFLGQGQSADDRLPTADAAFTTAANQVNSDGVKGFIATADQEEFGGVSVTWSHIQNEDDADVTENKGTSVFALGAGLYHITGVFYGNQGSDSDAFLALTEVLSGTDDTIRASGKAQDAEYLGTGAQFSAIYQFKYEYVRATATRKFYIRLRNNTELGLAGYLVFENLRG